MSSRHGKNDWVQGVRRGDDSQIRDDGSRGAKGHRLERIERTRAIDRGDVMTFTASEVSASQRRSRREARQGHDNRQVQGSPNPGYSAKTNEGRAQVHAAPAGRRTPPGYKWVFGRLVRVG